MFFFSPLRQGLKWPVLVVGLLMCWNTLDCSSGPVRADNPKFESDRQLKAQNTLKPDLSDSQSSESIKPLRSVIVDLDYPIIDLNTTTKLGNEILIEISADILFDFDQSTLKSSAFPSLRSAAQRIRDTARGDIRIDGHTDSKGSNTYNQTLSEARAQSVRDWLVENAQLSDFTFIVSGWGETKPVQPNQTDQGEDNPAGRQRNRRVEIIIKTSG